MRGGANLLRYEKDPMNEPIFDADAFIVATAPLLGLVVDASSHAAVKTHLDIAARYAALLEGAAITDHEEPAPVFTP
jgi:Protein of unknown function (DUF4089)